MVPADYAELVIKFYKLIIASFIKIDREEVSVLEPSSAVLIVRYRVTR